MSAMNKDTETHLLNPPPGSAAARARDFGIDLTLTLQRLRLTPTERVRQLQSAMSEMENMRAGQRSRDVKTDDQNRAGLTTVDTASG
ncbi:MAG TPA: hypothetical protein VF656_02580 [Pyrinomonadaceae bacterium]|jgi:hypothetical protein